MLTSPSRECRFKNSSDSNFSFWFGTTLGILKRNLGFGAVSVCCGCGLWCCWLDDWLRVFAKRLVVSIGCCKLGWLKILTVREVDLLLISGLLMSYVSAHILPCEETRCPCRGSLRQVVIYCSHYVAVAVVIGMVLLFFSWQVWLIARFLVNVPGDVFDLLPFMINSW